MSLPAIPALSDTWNGLLADSEYSYVRQARTCLGLWSEWEHLPEAFGWVEDSGPSLERLLDVLADREEDQAQGFWASLCQDHLACLHLQLWKVHELVAGAVTLLNTDRPVASAGPARAALEATLIGYLLADRQHRALEALAKSSSRADEVVAGYVSYLERALYGSSSETAEHKPIHVTKARERFLKLCTDPDTSEVLESVYVALCDAVHPSANGHQSYWIAGIENAAGQRLFHLRRGENTSAGLELAESVVWSVAWSSAWTLRVFDHTTKSISKALQKPPLH